MLRSFTLTLALLAVLAIGSPASTAPLFTTFVEVNCGGPVDDERQSNAAGDAISCNAGLAQGFAQVNSGIGAVRLLGTAGISLGSTGSANARGRANGRVQDTFTLSAIDSAGNSVTSGFFTAQIGVQAELTTSGAESGRSGNATLFYTASVGSASTGTRRLFANPSAGGPPSASLDGVIELVVPWSAGASIPLSLQAEVTAIAGSVIGGSAFGEADFGNSLDWLGIVSVTDGSGNAVASFQALNDQGFDYAAVPEPGAALLWLFGLGGIARLGGWR